MITARKSGGGESNLRTRLRGRALLGWLGYALYLLVAVTVIDYLFFFLPYRARLIASDPPPLLVPESDCDGVNLSVLRLVGQIADDKDSHFEHFSCTKPPGIVRLCALGDSFTAGAEVAHDQDYPTWLGRLFREKGMSDVQVLNFGTSWHGFHQNYIVWEEIASAFDCDAVLLGPASFQPLRDTTFNHTDLRRPYYLHARYILSEGDVRRIDVLGKTPQQRFDRYFSFLTPLRYLRYDREPPPFMRAALPAGRTIANPFYYSNLERNDEAYETYRILLAKMAATIPQLVLVHSDQRIVDVGRAVGAPNLAVARMPDLAAFPRTAPIGHRSAWGNRLVAEVFYSHLVTGGSQAPIGVVMHDADDLWPVAAQRPGRGLYEYDGISVEIDGKAVGIFVLKTIGEPPRQHSADELAASRVISLIGLREPSGSLVDGIFLPLDFEVRSGMRLSIVIGSDPPLELGSAVVLGQGVNIGIVDVAGMSVSSTNVLRFDSNTISGLDLSWSRIRSARLVLGGHVIARRSDEQVFGFVPNANQLWRVRVDQDGTPPPYQLSEGGLVEFVLHQRDGGELRAPLAHWSREPLSIEPLQPPLLRTITRARMRPDHAVESSEIPESISQPVPIAFSAGERWR